MPGDVFFTCADVQDDRADALLLASLIGRDLIGELPGHQLSGDLDDQEADPENGDEEYGHHPDGADGF